MFQFPAFALSTLCIRVKVPLTWWVSPFGYPRINAYSQLPVAFRSVSRPSSPLIAKASTKCSYHSLDSSLCINNLLSILLSKIFYPFIFLQIKVYYTLLHKELSFFIFFFFLFTLFYNYLISQIKSLFGGGKEDRTPDPLLAKQVLSQLSYTPNLLVGLGRLELPTSRLSGVRSNHLSYKPIISYRLATRL